MSSLTDQWLSADTIGEAKHKYLEWEEGKFPLVRLYEKVSAAMDGRDEEEVMKLL